MFFEMMCSCSATLQIDGSEDDQNAIWLFARRFADAHVACGFMLPERQEKKSDTHILDLPKEQDS